MPLYGATVTKDTARPELRSLQAHMRDREAISRVAGVAGTQVLRDHFTEREADPSSHTTAALLGARPVGLFAQFARGTHFETTADGVRLVVSHPAIMQRLKGGRILPTGGRRFLTVPANQFAYGRRAREVGVNLVFAFAPRPGPGELKMMPALVAPEAVEKETGPARKDGTRRKKTVRPSGVYYWLIRSATHSADPSTVPTNDAIRAGVEAQIDGWVRERINKGKDVSL